MAKPRVVSLAAIRKMETICAKMEDMNPDLRAHPEIHHKLISLKSRMIDLLREAEATRNT